MEQYHHHYHRQQQRRHRHHYLRRHHYLIIDRIYCRCQVRTSYLPSEIRWGECLEPLITFHKNDGRYCIDFTHFHHTTATAMKMPVCSAKAWSELCRRAIDDRSAIEDCDHPASFRSTMLRSIGFPSEPTQRVLFPLVSKKKRLRKVGAQQCPVRSRSCTEMLQFLSSSPSPLKLNLSAVALYQPAPPV